MPSVGVGCIKCCVKSCVRTCEKTSKSVGVEKKGAGSERSGTETSRRSQK